MHRSPRWCFTLSVLFVVVLSAGCSKSPIDRAQAFLDAGMASQAVPLLQIEIQANPKNARSHLMLGQASLILNDQAAAKESFDRAVLLNPGWADKVGRAYLDAANKLISGDPSETRLAVSYLETAREKTRSLDKDIARSLRRAGLRVGSAELLRSAVQTDATLAKDDSVAAYLAISGGQDPGLRISTLEQFLGQFPKSALRPTVLVQIAQAEMAVGNRPKAKAYAQEVVTLPGDPAAAAEAKSLLEQIASVEQAEVEAGVAAQQAQAQTQQAQARQKLIEQEAQARAAQAQAEAKAAQAGAEAELAARRAAAEAVRREELARVAQILPGNWYFDLPYARTQEGRKASVGSYIAFGTVDVNGAVAGYFVNPAHPNPQAQRVPFRGAVRGTGITLDDEWPGSIQRRWTGVIDLESRAISGRAVNIQGGEWEIAWTVRKR